MGFLDWLFGQPKPQYPSIASILPDVAKDEIRKGRLPHINVDILFTKQGEICHYADQAVLMVEKKKKVAHTQNRGVSIPGLFGETRYYRGGSTSTANEETEIEYHKGMLFITNKRIIFTSKNTGFDKQYRYLSAIKPYSNAIELQYASEIYSVFVPDGAIAYAVIQMLK